MEHRRLDHLDDVGAVNRRARVARVRGREADLVVNDDVHRAAGAIAARLREIQRLHHDALAGERGVAVHQHRQHLVALAVATPLLARAHRALDHRIDDLEVRRVERQRQMHRSARCRDVAGKAHVVLDVACRQVGPGLALELGEQFLRHLAERVHQHVEPSAMCHADHDLFDSGRTGALDQLIHRRDEGLTTLEREALLADILGVQEALESLGRGQPLEDVQFFLCAESRRRTHRLKPLLDPALLRRIGDVHVLRADTAAIGLAQRGDDLAQRHVLLPEIRVGRGEHDVHVRFGQVVERRLELRDLRALLALQRVEVGPAIAQIAVGRDDRLDMNLLARHREVGRRDFLLESARLGALRERFDDRRVRDVARARRAVGRRHQLHLVEVGAPFFGHRARIVEVALVQVLDVWRVAAEQIRVGLGTVASSVDHLSERVSR